MPNYLTFWRRPLLTAFTTAALLAGCARLDIAPSNSALAPTDASAGSPTALSASAVAATGLSETFETGTKTAYTSGTVALGSGS